MSSEESHLINESEESTPTTSYISSRPLDKKSKLTLCFIRENNIFLLGKLCHDELEQHLIKKLNEPPPVISIPHQELDEVDFFLKFSCRPAKTG